MVKTKATEQEGYTIEVGMLEMTYSISITKG